ncbi:hypothetical protein Acr_00g0044290 [Actinidia rufa]|uniref:RNase H type-1 domain-containing protein n=1 Tax=Actinidia rufa TaxID=165716 RepID=A0A7J0DIV5_9ERIC|nr:hypothetical protein Acr_00g0044290 [Actinidia rufa]
MGSPNERREAIPRYQTPFSRQIEGLDPPEKFTPLRFTLYDGKSDPRSHVSHVKQMIALWNHMDALMCWVFPLSLGNLGLKWFNKLPPRSIENFHQFTESFIDLMSRVEIFARLEDNVKQAEKVIGTSPRARDSLRSKGTIPLVLKARDPDAKVKKDLMRYELDEPSSDYFFLTSANLEERERTELNQLLKANIEVFAWTPYEMPRMNPDFIKHELNVIPNAQPVNHRGRRSAAEHVDVVIEDINQLVDSTSGHARMSFLDAYRGYHQIAMHELDQEKTTPILGKTMDAYIDNMVVKSREEVDYIRDLTEVFMGIKENLEQIIAINDLVSPRTTKEVQKPTGMIAALNRFIIKGQVLADFVVEFSPQAMSLEEGCLASTHRREESPKVVSFESRLELGGLEVTEPKIVRIRCQNSFEKPRGAIFKQCLQMNFPTTNNEAEYEVLIAELRFASKLKIPKLHIFSDSKLVVNQATEKFVTRGVKMAKYLVVAKNLLTKFKVIKIEQVERDQNSHADALAGLASIFKGEAGRSHQQDNHERNQKKAGESQRKVGRGAATRFVGLSDHTAEATNETPNALAFNFEAVIPLEVGLPTIRTKAYDANHNEEVLARDLDLVDERQENALIRMTDYQKQLAKTYNQKVQHKDFIVGDLILRKVFGNTKYLVDGKLGTNWEGPYKIVNLATRGAYCLKDLEGKQTLRP